MNKKIILILLLTVSLSGCASLNPWSEKDPDNRMRKSPCACLETSHVG